MKELAALALATGATRRRRLSAREEELLGLLAGIPDGDGGSDDRELSFSDLIEAGACRPPPPSVDDDAEPTDLGVAPTSASVAPRPREDDRPAAASKKQRQQAARQRAARRSGGSRGSCGGDGVLLNFYVPGLLTRSMTTPRPTRGGQPSPGAVQGQGAPAKTVTTAAVAAAAGKTSRAQTTLGIGCWPALWGRGRRTAKACS